MSKAVRVLSTISLFATGSRRFHPKSEFANLPGFAKLKLAALSMR